MEKAGDTPTIGVSIIAADDGVEDAVDEGNDDDFSIIGFCSADAVSSFALP